MYNLSIFKDKAKQVPEWLVKELSTVRTGRANPSVLDSVMVDSYGALMGIAQVASVTLEDARSIRIVPWDNTQIKPIEKAITVANLGLSVSVDDKGVRVSFPALTTESRMQVVKMAKEKLEQGRITLRKHRDEVISDIEKKAKESAVTEDEKFKLKAEIQKVVDELNAKMQELFDKKEKEVLS